MNLHLILAQGHDKSSLYRSNFKICATEASTLISLRLWYWVWKDALPEDLGLIPTCACVGLSLL